MNRLTGYKRLLALAALSGGAAPVEDTVTGNPATFETDLAKPLKSLVANFLPVQASGTPSPENVLPITGWTGLNVWHGGKNLFSTTLEQGAISVINGNDSGSDSRVRSVGFIHLSAGKYTVSAVGVGQAFFYVYDANGQYIQSESSAGFTNIPRTLTLVGDRYVRITFRVSSNNENVIPADVSNVQLEVGDTATEYEAPNITSYPVTWSESGTIYGGFVDLVTGEVWATYEGIDSTWNQGTNTAVGTSFTRKTFAFVHSVRGVDTGFYSSKCNCATLDWSVSWNTHYYIDESKAYLWLPNETDSDFSVQFVTRLKEPLLITTLTPTQINAIIGGNTVWSDGNGDCEVTFLKKG